MLDNYFKIDEDFEKIIRNALNEEIIEMNNVATGWTNIVYEVSTKSRKLFFPFP